MFRTELPIAPATDQLPRTARVLTAGSCFADSIGSRLASHKVATLVNPFGTVFQPLALAKLLRAAAGEEVDWQQHVVQARGRWQSYDLHGSIGAESPVDLLQHIQELVRSTGEFLRQADVVLLTLGTAWAYRLRETGELVNNCHKQPADLFVKELLTPDEVINGLAETHAYLRRINPKLRFVLTVSPVRHLKDTLPLNAVSKSVLRVATHVLSDLLPEVAYFPAYELLLDDLRDYRFYASDMLHPSELAEDYIWDKYARTYFDSDFGRFRKEWAGVQQSLKHRPLHEGAPEHRQFLLATAEKLEQLSLRKVEVTTELDEVRAKILALPLPKQPEPEIIPDDDEERIDIGAYAAPAEVSGLAATDSDGAEVPAQTEGRTPRLSPEEFRAQRTARAGGRPERGRRDGRGRGQQQPPAENEEFQSVQANNAEPVEPKETVSSLVPNSLELGASDEQVEQVAAPSLDADMPGAEELGKKKKRRSRGGAKRTARKHALRLAAGETALDDAPVGTAETAATPIAAPAAGASNQLLEGKESSVNPSPAPAKRGGRRDETSRIPRAPLFAPATQTPAAPETPGASGAAAAVSQPPFAPSELDAAADTAQPAANESVAPKARKGRNRGKKSTPRTTDAPAPNSSEILTPNTAVAATPAGAADEPALTRASGAEADAQRQQPAGPARRADALAASAPAETPAATAEVAQPTAQPRRNSRPKRAVSGARPEKPAVDTPIIPVPDETQVRTQVAAGRMTGSSAILVEPTPEVVAPAKKKPAAKKPVAQLKAASSRSKAEQKTPVPVTEPAQAKAKPAAKSAPKPAAESVAKPAAKPRAAKPEPAAPPAPPAQKAAAKPKAPRKPPKSS